MENSCRLCNSDNIVLLKHGVRDNSKIDVFKCKNCGLEFLSQTFQADKDFYSKGRMHSTYNVENWFKSTYADDFRRAEFLKNVLKNKNVLDFGTGNGGFLIQAGKYANNICGCDLDESLDEHYKKYDLNVKHNLSELGNISFDVITMFHVLEHIDNPELILEKLKEFLNYSGQLIIEVPNSEDALLTLYKSTAFENFTYWSCHLYAYNFDNIKILLKKSGYKVKNIKFIQRYPYTNHVGWLKDKTGGGHKKYTCNKAINYVYEKFLQCAKKTDTILVTAVPI